MANPKLVNKQFNSPIGLYSEANVREVLERESQILANGAVGINFKNPHVGTKPANLQNSAVLRMLEEEERQRNGYGPGAKRVAWPPPHEGGDYVEQEAVQAQGGPQYTTTQAAPIINQNHYNNNSTAPLKPLNISAASTAAAPLSSPGNQFYNQQQSHSPNSPLLIGNTNQTPQGFRPQTPVNKQWAPVHSPVHTPQSQLYNQPQYPSSQQYQQQQQPSHYQNQNQQPPQYQNQNQQPSQYQNQQPVYTQNQPPSSGYYNNNYNQAPVSASPHQVSQQPFVGAVAPPSAPVQVAPQQYQSAPVAAPQQHFVAAPTRAVEPPPTTITLRPQAPVSQAPPPLITSQPATATLQGGKHLRGDLKWPPENVKHQMEEENRQRIELARGPACRPRKVHKDYSQFFAQHALNSSYPGYKIPPGTQFYRPE